MPSPGLDVTVWSHTPLSNGNADPSINFVENQARSSLNDSCRAAMAAVAIDRDLKNGSITTAGTAAAQTFASGASYTSMPTAPWRCTLNMGFTNPGAFTLNMDSIGAKSVKTSFGGDPDVGVIVAGMYIDFIWNGTNFIMMPSSQSADPALAGILQLNSPSLLQFVPKAGNKIKINGLQYVIPNTGIAGLGNTSVFVNGTGGQNLAANTNYYVFAFNNGGTITGDFRTDGAGHMVDTTGGNQGVEVRQITVGNPDATRTLIGLIRTTGAAQFADSLLQRFVRSWFNRRRMPLSGASGQISGFSTSGGNADLTSYTGKGEFVAFSDDCVEVNSVFAALDSVGGSATNVFSWAAIDGSALGGQSLGYTTNGIQWCTTSSVYSAYVTEGYHYLGGVAGTGNSDACFIIAQFAGNVG